MMRKASGIFGITVGEPQWVEILTSKTADYNNAIKTDIDPKVCKIVVVIINNAQDKKFIKQFLDKGGVCS